MDRGYIRAQVEKLDIKTIDPLASPKPVRLEAVVTEGPLCRLSAIEFAGNHALSSDVLRAKFPLKVGQTFQRSRIGSGMEAIRKLYDSKGYLNAVFIPEMTFESASVKLNVEVEEGPQYHLEKFEVVGPPEVAQKLEFRWELPVGGIYDGSYIDAFLERNHSLLPSSFTRWNGVELLTDCPDATVSVHLHLARVDAQHQAQDDANDKPCPTRDSDYKSP